VARTLGIGERRRPSGKTRIAAVGKGAAFAKDLASSFSRQDVGLSNVLLVHGPECKNLGTKKVRGTNPMGPSPGNVRGVGFGHKGGIGAETHDYVDDNGLETVTSWECELGCPIAILDELSGELTSNGQVAAYKDHGGYGGYAGTTHPPRPTDTGGASRFFPQFANELELVAWVRRLISPDDVEVGSV